MIIKTTTTDLTNTTTDFTLLGIVHVTESKKKFNVRHTASKMVYLIFLTFEKNGKNCFERKIYWLGSISFYLMFTYNLIICMLNFTIIPLIREKNEMETYLGPFCNELDHNVWPGNQVCWWDRPNCTMRYWYFCEIHSADLNKVICHRSGMPQSIKLCIKCNIVYLWDRPFY